jgi:hypothetical protein
MDKETKNNKCKLQRGFRRRHFLPTEAVEAGGYNAALLSCTFDQFVVEEIVNCSTDEEI